MYDLFPKLRELLSIERMCRLVGFSDDLTKRILSGRKAEFKGCLYSPEYKQKFSTEHSTAQIKPESLITQESYVLLLTALILLNGFD